MDSYRILTICTTGVSFQKYTSLVMLIVVEDATNHKYFINTVDGMFLLEII